MSAALVDGESSDSIPLDDRGLAYGDGVFETLPLVDGRALLWSAHYRRLSAGCRRLGFAPPAEASLLADLRSLTEASLGDSVIKIVVTRGSGGRGYSAPAVVKPRRIVRRLAWPEYPLKWWHSGVAVRFCETALSYRPRLGATKHLNRLEQVLAQSEWDDPDTAEGIVSTDTGEICEGTMTNVFAVTGGRIVTPPVEGYGVAGVVREWLLDMSDADLPTCEQSLAAAELLAADEVFLTNSLIGLWPVRRLGSTRHWESWPVAGELLRRLRTARAVPDERVEGR